MKMKEIAGITAIVAVYLIVMIVVFVPGKREKSEENTLKTVLADAETESEQEESADIESVQSDVLMKGEEEKTDQKKTAKEEAEKDTAKKKKEVYNGPYAGKFMVNLDSEYLNIRKAADKNSEIIGKLYVGSGGDVVKRGKKWTKISSGSVKGYVSSEYLLFDKDAEKKANECGTLEVTITADSLRVRKEPNTESEVLGLVANGETYVGLRETEGWISISFENQAGYISSDYVSTKLTVGKAISIEEELEAIRLEQDRLAAEKAEAERKAREEAEAIARAAAASKLVETVQESPYNVSEEEAYMLACVVASEAGYECYEGQLAVANIVLNRLKSGRYGATMKDVLYASGQFTVVNTERFANMMAAGPYDISLKATKDALSGTNNVPGFTSFCATWAASYDSYNEYTIIGNQVYHR